MSESISSKSLEILTFIAACPAATAKYEALRVMFAEDHIDDRLGQLEKDGYIEIIEDEPCSYDDGLISTAISGDIVACSLTHEGIDAVDLFQQRCRQAAQQENNERRKEQLQNEHWSKDSRRSWVQWTITTILSITAFFSGAVIEMLTGLMERIWSAIHEIVSFLF